MSESGQNQQQEIVASFAMLREPAGFADSSDPILCTEDAVRVQACNKLIALAGKTPELLHEIKKNLCGAYAHSSNFRNWLKNKEAQESIGRKGHQLLWVLGGRTEDGTMKFVAELNEVLETSTQTDLEIQTFLQASSAVAAPSVGLEQGQAVSTGPVLPSR